MNMIRAALIFCCLIVPAVTLSQEPLSEEDAILILRRAEVTITNTGASITIREVADKGTLDALRSLPRLATVSIRSTDPHKVLAALPDLPTVKRVNIDGGKVLKDEHLANLSRLPNLTSAFLDMPLLTDAGLSHLATHKDLKELRLTRTAVTKQGVDKFYETSPKCIVTGVSPPTEAQGSKVVDAAVLAKSLDATKLLARVGIEVVYQKSRRRSAVRIAKKGLTKESLAPLRDIHDLETVIISTNAPLVLLRLPELPQVTSVGLVDVEDADLVGLSRFPNLTSLSVTSRHITADSLKHFEPFKHLQTLMLDGANLSNADVEAFKTAMPKCEIHRR